MLRQVFDYFDRDKTGQIDASEMDAVLLKLGVKLSKEAFDKMLKDADMDCKLNKIENVIKKSSFELNHFIIFSFK